VETLDERLKKSVLDPWGTEAVVQSREESRPEGRLLGISVAYHPRLIRKCVVESSQMTEAVQIFSPGAFPTTLEAIIRASFPASMLILADMEPPLASLTTLFVHQSTTPPSVGALFSGFEIPCLALVGDGPTGLEDIWQSAQEWAETGATTVLYESQLVPPSLRGRQKSTDTWMAAELLPSISIDSVKDVEPISDTGELLAFYKICGMSYWTPEMLRFGHYWGIRKRRDLVAVAGVDFILAEPSYAQLANVATHPDHRRMGLATTCIQACLASLSQAGVSRCGLFVEATNVIAIRLYERLGLRITGYFDFYFPAVNGK